MLSDMRHVNIVKHVHSAQPMPARRQNMGFTCPTTEQKDALRMAIRNGDINWHAFPHNAELENTSPAMLEEGIKSTKFLDRAFGLQEKRFFSQRDVPGVPRSVIPLMRRNGVKLLTYVWAWRHPARGNAVNMSPSDATSPRPLCSVTLARQGGCQRRLNVPPGAEDFQLA